MKPNSIQFLSGLLFILSLTSIACKSKSGPAPDLVFMKCWTNAFEEEQGQGNIRIYRPCATHTFPAAHYRHTFTLKEGGVAEYSVLAPNDAHTTETGNWTYHAPPKKLWIGNIEYEFLEIKEDLLRLKE